ncbi:MAG: host attachment protein [Litoreibacter sp.]|nr:host attachment protein [Litoreibacter sp.]
MKPVETWILLANATFARVVANRGPGKGIVAMGGKTWRADPPVDYSDEAGHARMNTTYSQASLTSKDPKELAEHIFATQLAEKMIEFRRKGAYDRLIVVASPHMLGSLRETLPDAVTDTVAAEVAKDLTHATLEELPKLLSNVIAA